MRRETQNVLLVLVGGVLVKIVLDGTYLRWVAPWSAPIILAAGVVVVVLALAAIVRDVRAGAPVDAGHAGHGEDQDAPGTQPREHAGHHHDGHEGSHGAHSAHSTPSAWLMLLPVLAVLLVAPPALGSGALSDGRVRAVADPDAAAAAAIEPLPPGPAPALGVLDFVSRAVAAPHGPLTARDVTLTGFLAPGPSPDRPDLARWTISCCAADASAVRVHLNAPPGLLPAPVVGGPDQWVQLRGRLVPGTGTAADEHVPTLTVIDSLPVDAPERVYEY